MATDVLCPAGEDVHPVLSLNPLDVRCRVVGNLRPARSPRTGEKVVCCDEYTNCRVWQRHKEAEQANSTKKQRDEHFSAPHSGVMKHASRD